MADEASLHREKPACTGDGAVEDEFTGRSAVDSVLKLFLGVIPIWTAVSVKHG